MEKVVIYIKKLDNNNDSIRLENSLKKKDKIKKAVVDLKTSSVILSFYDLTIEEIERYIEEAGYESLEVELLNEEKNLSLYSIIIFGILLGVIMYLLLATMFHLPFQEIGQSKIFSFLLWITTIIFIIYGKDILVDGIKNNLKGRSNYNSFISLDILLIFLYGSWNIYTFSKEKASLNYMYLIAILLLIYFSKLGKYLEKKTKKKIELELDDLTKLNHYKGNKKEKEIFQGKKIESIKEGDTILCLPGDRILLDGSITEGSSHLDESFINGNSLPIEKEKTNKVLAGSINCEAKIEYIVEKTLKETDISKISKIGIDEKRKKKVTFNKIDKLCNYLVPILFIINTIILFLTYLITGNIDRVITQFIINIIISCPLAFSIIEPLEFQRNKTITSKKGFFIKNKEAMELSSKIDTIIFDKTATLTNGYLSVSHINNHSEMTDKDILELLGSIEKQSTHAIARGIIKYLKVEKIKSRFDFTTEDLFGYGVKAKDEENIYYACNSELLEKLDIINSYKEEERKLKTEGCYVIYLVKNNKVIATIGLKDIPRKESPKVLEYLKEKNMEIIMLTGDSEIPANKIARELGIEKVIGGMNPIEKLNYVKGLIKEGKQVMMVGDGINDAPALAASTIGVTFRNISAVPVEQADVIITNNNLLKILEFFAISKKALQEIKRNVILSLIIMIVLFGIVIYESIKERINFLLVITGLLINVVIVLAKIRIKSK